MKKTDKTVDQFGVPVLSSADIYLIFYNVLQFFGWSIVFIQTVHYLSFHGLETSGIWKETSSCLKIFQTLALLEIVHVMVGFVRSSVVTTAVQVYSRVFILWPICHLVEASQMSKGIPLILIAWSVTEMIRYSFYFLNILKMAPYFLIYLRYTLFIALYPIGVTGELLCLYTALPYIAKTKMFTYTMPNLFNFTFDFYYCCIITMFLYIPIFPQLYLHMFSQRRKTLSVDHGKKSK